MGLLIITKDIDHEGVNAEPWIKYLQIHVNLASFSNSWFLIVVGIIIWYFVFSMAKSHWFYLYCNLWISHWLMYHLQICLLTVRGMQILCLLRCWRLYTNILLVKDLKQSLYSSYLALLFDILDGNCVALVEHNDPENSIVATMNYTHHVSYTYIQLFVLIQEVRRSGLL